jgi:hypothetical protein
MWKIYMSEISGANHVVQEVYAANFDNDHDGPWTPVPRRKNKKTNAELVEDFWVEMGFPMSAS